MPIEYILITVGLVLLCFMSFPFFNRLYKRDQEKHSERVIPIRKTSLLSTYLDGIDAFRRNIRVKLELLPYELSIKEHPGINRVEADKSASLPYSRIIGVDFVQAKRYGDVGIFRNILLENEPILIIKYLTSEGETKELLFKKILSAKECNLFMNSLKVRIPIQHPKHTEL